LHKEGKRKRQKPPQSFSFCFIESHSTASEPRSETKNIHRADMRFEKLDPNSNELVFLSEEFSSPFLFLGLIHFHKHFHLQSSPLGMSIQNMEIHAHYECSLNAIEANFRFPIDNISVMFMLVTSSHLVLSLFSGF
jgi:hypothetical protein